MWLRESLFESSTWGCVAAQTSEPFLGGSDWTFFVVSPGLFGL